MPYKILVINPGGVSTKIALFHDEKAVFKRRLNIRHLNLANTREYLIKGSCEPKLF